MARAPAAAATDDGTPAQPYRWAMLAGVWLIYYSFGMTMASMAPLVQVIEGDLAISHSTMGTVLGAWPLVYIASSAPCGALLDRFGPRRMILGISIVALSGALRGLSTSYVELFLSVVVFGIGGPLVSSGAPKVISLWFSGKDRGLAVGIYYTGNALGGITALSLTNSAMMPAFGGDWRNVLLAYAGFVVFAGLAWLLVSAHPASRDMERRLAAEHKPPFLRVLSELLRNPVVRIVLVMAVFILFFNHGLNNWLPTVLISYGMDAATAGYWASLPTIAGLFSALILPRLATQPRRFVVLGTLIGCGAVATLLVLTATMPWLGVGLILTGITRGAMTGIAILILMDGDHADSRHIGAASGLYFSAGEIGGALGPMSMGVLAEATGSFAAPLLMMTGVCVVLALLLARLRYLVGKPA